MMNDNIEEQEIHEATIDLKDGADDFAARCVEACREADGKPELESVLGLAWDLLSGHPFWRAASAVEYEGDEDDDIGDHLAYALRVGIAIGQNLGRGN